MNDFREYNDYLMHFGILGMKWGIRRYQNPDGTLTTEGKRHYADTLDNYSIKKQKFEDRSKQYSNKSAKYRAAAEKYSRRFSGNPEKAAKYLKKAGHSDAKAYKNIKKSEKLNKKINNMIKTLNKQGYQVTSKKQYLTNKKVVEVFDKFQIYDDTDK